MGFIGALALVAALVVAAQGEQIENTHNDPIIWEGALVCANIEREPDDEDPPECMGCCSKYGFTKGVFWGPRGGGKMFCICRGFDLKAAAEHASESANEKDYTSCAQYQAKNNESGKCRSCCRSLGFKIGSFSGAYSDGHCCCIGSKDNKDWGY